MDALAIRAVLARAPRLDAKHVQALVATAGGELERVLEPRTLAQAQMPPEARAFLLLPDEAALAADLAWIATSGVQLILGSEPTYPPQLLQTRNAPAVLFVLGRISALSAAQLAIVGSRDPTPVGRKTALDFARVLASAGLTITSGLATGIDAASHEGALLAGGSTVAVCGTGLDRVYPIQHTGLAARIRERGALLSEFPPRTPPRRGNFPQRNRVIAGLARGTLVVEAAQRSGSLITARWAVEQGREVFAVPGSIYSPLSFGCHQLIRAGAILVQEPAQVLSELRIPFQDEVLAHTAEPPGALRALDKEYEMLLDAVGFEPATVDILASRTGLPGESIASMLLILELEGRIAPYPGGRYGRIPR
jgi:DNA processing protein